MSVVESTELDELRARLAKLEQTQATGQGGSWPHTAILAGAPPHTVLGPCGADGRVLPGAWNPDTGFWEDEAEAAAYQAQKAADEAARVQAAREALDAANQARAMEVARQQLADEEAFSRQVEAAKAQLQGGTGAASSA